MTLSTIEPRPVSRRIQRLTFLRSVLVVAVVFLGARQAAQALFESRYFKIKTVEIDRTLRQATADGRLARFETETRSRILRGIEDPAPIAGITRATSRRTRYHDPSMLVPEAITDATGRVVVSAGTVVNPLDTVTLLGAREDTDVTLDERQFDDVPKSHAELGDNQRDLVFGLQGRHLFGEAARLRPMDIIRYT